MIRNIFGERIKSYRRRTGLGIKTAAPGIGIDYTTLSKIESGAMLPSHKTLSKIFNFYDLNDEEKNETAGFYGNLRKGVTSMDKDERMNPAVTKINVDVTRVPTLYSDAVQITSNENGFVLNFAQQTGPTNQYNVIARIGMSKTHVMKLSSKLKGLAEKGGSGETSKVKFLA